MTFSGHQLPITSVGLGVTKAIAAKSTILTFTTINLHIMSYVCETNNCIQSCAPLLLSLAAPTSYSPKSLGQYLSPHSVWPTSEARHLTFYDWKNYLETSLIHAFGR